MIVRFRVNFAAALAARAVHGVVEAGSMVTVPCDESTLAPEELRLIQEASQEREDGTLCVNETIAANGTEIEHLLAVLQSRSAPAAAPTPEPEPIASHTAPPASNNPRKPRRSLRKNYSDDSFASSVGQLWGV